MSPSTWPTSRSRRLPVLDRDKRLVGILSLADIATSDETEQAAGSAQRHFPADTGDLTDALHFPILSRAR